MSIVTPTSLIDTNGKSFGVGDRVVVASKTCVFVGTVARITYSRVSIKKDKLSPSYEATHAIVTHNKNNFYKLENELTPAEQAWLQYGREQGSC